MVFGLEFQIGANVTVQVDASLFPLALHGSFRHSSNFGDFTKGKSAEELQIDHLCEWAIDLGQFVDGIADLAELPRIGGIIGHPGVISGDLKFATAFLRAPVAGVVDDQAAHNPRGISQKAVLIRKLGTATARDVEIGFVQKSRCTEANGSTPTAQFSPSQSVQFGIEHLKQRVLRRAVAAIDGL